MNDIDIEKLTDEDWIKLAYICLLQRKIDSVGYDFWIQRLNTGIFRYKELIDTLITSPEFLMHYNTPFSAMLHNAREKWVQNLDFFETILDIGGSSPNIEMGTLIELGYLHRPKKLVIFDLPPNEQYWGTPKYNQQKKYSFSWGSVEYVYGHAEKIDVENKLKTLKFDCIFMGQTIEHIKPESLPNLLKFVKDHLNDKGKFIFDTPNRIITKIQSPDTLIDKDHKYEYTPHELERILTENHFKIIKKWGLLEMNGSYRSNIFNPLEVYETAQITDNINSAYCFAMECEIL